MRYNISINQKAIFENGFENDLDLIDASILDIINGLFRSSFVKKMTHKGNDYYWVNNEIVAKEMPLLKVSNRTLRRRIDDLITKGFLQRCEDNKTMATRFLRPTLKLQSLYYYNPLAKKDTPCPNMANPLAKYGQPPWPNMANYNSTNNNTTNNNSSIAADFSKSTVSALPYQEEFLEVYEIIKAESGNAVRLNFKKIKDSNKYKDFVRFYKEHKKEHPLAEIKEVIKFKCKQNLGTTGQTYSRFSTLFRKKNYENNLDEYLTSKNKPYNGLKNNSGTNIPDADLNLPKDDLNRFEAIFKLVNDSRFTKAVYKTCFGGKKWLVIRSKYSSTEIIQGINKSLADLSRAYNKNRSLSDLINQNL